MNARIMATGYLAALCAALGAADGAAAQTDPADAVEIKITPVAGPIHLLEGRGGNIGVSAGPDGILIVDDQYAPLSKKIRAALRQLHPGGLEFVLNTHWHGDHTGGNINFGQEATIIAHTNVRKRLATVQSMFGNAIEPTAPNGLPMITFDRSVSIHFNGEQIDVVHYPNGHTDGDLVVFFSGSKVVHMGDHFFNGMFPFVDLDHGGDVEGLARNIKSVIDRVPSDVKIIPGHGPLATLDELKTYHAMLVETTNIVRAAITGNVPLAEIQKHGMPEKWKPWGSRFISSDRWIATIHRSLSH